MNDRIYMNIADIEELQYRFHCAVEMVMVVHTVITQSDSDENVCDALLGAYRHLKSLDQEMAEDVEKLWLAYRYEKTVGHLIGNEVTA